MSLMYRILSKKLSQAVAIKICHLVEIRIEMSKMAEGDEYLDSIHETLEWAANPWSTSLDEIMGFELFEISTSNR